MHSECTFSGDASTMEAPTLRILTMIPVLPTAISTAVKFPAEARGLDSAAIFQLGRLAASYENRAWAREKVRQAKTIVAVAVKEELQSSVGGSEVARDQLKDREQVLVSLERFYKKMRHHTHDHFPEALSIMEQMIPGSTQGLSKAVPTVSTPPAVPNSLGAEVGP